MPRISVLRNITRSVLRKVCNREFLTIIAVSLPFSFEDGTVPLSIDHQSSQKEIVPSIVMCQVSEVYVCWV